MAKAKEEYKPTVLGISHSFDIKRAGKEIIPDYRFFDAAKKEIDLALMNGQKDVAVECSPESLAYYGELRRIARNPIPDYVPPKNLTETQKRNLNTINSVRLKDTEFKSVHVLLSLSSIERFWYSITGYLKNKGAKIHPLGDESIVTEASSKLKDGRRLVARCNEDGLDKLMDGMKLAATELEYKLRLNTGRLIEMGGRPELFIVGVQHHAGIMLSLKDKGVSSKKKIVAKKHRTLPGLDLKRISTRWWREYELAREGQLSRLNNALSNLRNKRQGKPFHPK